MKPQTKSTFRNVSLALGAILAAWSVVTASTQFVSKAIGVVDHRYVQQDSFRIYQAGQAAKDREMSIENARRDSLLRRVDRRIGLIYCGSLPPGKRAGCE